MKSGDYVRTNDGWICKLDYYDEERNRWITHDENDWYPVYKSDIKISSDKLIDLVEVDDYVNGYLVKSVDDCGVYIDIPFVDSESIGCDVDLIRTEQIKSIVTKEQFKEIEYEVK